MGKDATVWMRALRAHTYHGRPQDEGDFYMAVSDEVDNIVNLKFAVVVPSPPPAHNRSPVPPPDEAAVERHKVPATVEPITTQTINQVAAPRRRSRRP